MKKFIKIAFIYAMLAIACGVFYREFTKLNDFTGTTTLGFLHTHLFVLGMAVFLILALFEGQLQISASKKFKPFMIFYNIGVAMVIIMLIVRGVSQVLSLAVSDGMIAGIAGVGHTILTVGIILMFLMLIERAGLKEKNA